MNKQSLSFLLFVLISFVTAYGIDDLPRQENHSMQLSGERLQQEIARKKQLLAAKQAETEAARVRVAEYKAQLAEKRKAQQEEQEEKERENRTHQEHYFSERYTAMCNRMRQHKENAEIQLKIAQEEFDEVNAMANLSTEMEIRRQQHKKDILVLQDALNPVIAFKKRGRIMDLVGQGDVVGARRTLSEMEESKDTEHLDEYIKSFETGAVLQGNDPTITPEEIDQIVHERAPEHTICFFVPCAVLVGGMYGVSKLYHYLSEPTQISTHALEDLVRTFDEHSRYDQQQAKRMLNQLASQIESQISNATLEQKVVFRKIHAYIMSLTTRNNVTRDELKLVIERIKRYYC